MVFNWFRRQFDEDKNSQEAEKPAEAEEIKEPSPSTEPTPEPTTSPDSSPANPDLLSWAKAAYINIQQRELEQSPTELSTSSTSEVLEAAILLTQAEAIRTDIEVSEEAGAIAATPFADPVAPIQPEASIEAEFQDAIAAETSSQLTDTPTELVEPELQVEPIEVLTAEEFNERPEPVAESELPETTPETPIPFWAQSEADRQARIAALAANAVEEVTETLPVPEITETAAAPIILDDPDLPPFDEGFLWSAEILAAQGRRPQDISIEEITWLKRLRQGLDKTRLSLVNQLKALVGKGPLDADSIDDIESLLLQADVGVKATDEIVQALQTKLRNEVLPPEEAIAFLKQILKGILDAPIKGNKQSFSRNLVPQKNQLNIWLITGVNGAGKTTTIGKIAHLAQKSGYSTLIAAADTFRAAAVQQVQVWGDRAQVEVIANTGKNTDPAAVVFDAISAAQARGTELLLVDTAGRLQNKKNLMDELSKIRRIVDKKSAGATVESLLVLDATLGQNGLRQAEVFSQSAGISGVVLTKLDGTAKGGVALAVVQQLNLPIRFIGAGEGIEDLRPFSSYEFVEALLSN